jgi:hypothetical protein
MFLSCTVEALLLAARLGAPRGVHMTFTLDAPVGEITPALPWPKMSLPWLFGTGLAAFIGFAAGGYIDTELTISPRAPLLWVGGVIGAVLCGLGTGAVGYWMSVRRLRPRTLPTSGRLSAGPAEALGRQRGSKGRHP